MEQNDGRRVGNDFVLAPLRIIDPLSLIGKPIPSREWLWPDWIPMRAVTAFYGDGGTGKSLLSQQLMTCCAVGADFLGCTVRKCRVLGVFCEDDEDELHRRQASINQAMGLGFGDLEHMHWISRVGEENLLMTFAADGRGEVTPLYHQIVTAAKLQGVELVVIDTAADTFGGNENIRVQVRQFISALNRLALEINGAVMLLAHPSQSGRSTGSGDGGSTAWNNSVRSRLYLQRPVEEGSTTPVDPDARLLSRLKANYARTGDKVNLRWKNGAFEGDGAPLADERQGGGVDRLYRAQKAFIDGLRELTSKGMRGNSYKGQATYLPKQIKSFTAAADDFSVDELERAMSFLMREGRIRSVEEGPKSRRRSFIKEVAPDLPGT